MTGNFNPTSNVSRTLDGLLSNIVKGTYGDALPPQDELALRFNVSRTVMREALVILRFCNVLTIRPKIGTKINPRCDWSTAILPMVHGVESD